MEIVVSGIRPTGNLHLGNYFGAVKNFLRLQDEYKCFFFIADWHSLTTHPHPGRRDCQCTEDFIRVFGMWDRSRKGSDLCTE